MFERHSTLPLHVIKIGGSLLANTSDRSAIENAAMWLAQQSGSINVVIVGGGHAVDHLRHWQRQFNLTEKQAHLNAVQVMSLNTSRLARSSCKTSVITSWKALTNFLDSDNANPTTIMFDCLSFVQDVEVDEATDMLYWTDEDSGSTGASGVYRSDLEGNGQEALVIGLSSPKHLALLHVAADKAR